MLVSCKLLQAAAPANTEFVLTLGNPLPDTLLTVIQVGANQGWRAVTAGPKASHPVAG